MKTLVLCDLDDRHDNLLPLSFTRPIASFRVGIDTIADKWQAALGAEKVAHRPVQYLSPKYGSQFPEGELLYVAGHILPDPQLAQAVATLTPGHALVDDKGEYIARCAVSDSADPAADFVTVYSAPLRAVNYVFDIFLLNGQTIREDFLRITAGRTSMPLSQTCTLIGSPVDEEGTHTLFIEEGAKVEGAVINVTTGPVYIGRDAEVMEGACLRGPLALCDKARINMGAKVYGDTTIGPRCKVGGEVNNIVMFGYSNKSHDGFLGNAVIGEWCNIGAGVNASNLKNDYSKIRIWNYATHSFMRTDLQFCGLIMGDHSKIGINCMLNTATVMGVGVNLHGTGFPRTFIPSFSEGSPGAGFADVTLSKFCDIADRVLSRRGQSVSQADRDIFEAVRTVAAKYK